MSGPLNGEFLHHDRLVNFNKVIQACLQNPTRYQRLKESYPKFDGTNKNFTDRILRGEFVTSTEMNEIINAPHTLSDGTESYFTFAEVFADWCGYYTVQTININSEFHWIITDIEWANSIYAASVTLHKDFQC